MLVIRGSMVAGHGGLLRVASWMQLHVGEQALKLAFSQDECLNRSVSISPVLKAHNNKVQLMKK